MSSSLSAPFCILAGPRLSFAGTLTHRIVPRAGLELSAHLHRAGMADVLVSTGRAPVPRPTPSDLTLALSLLIAPDWGLACSAGIIDVIGQAVPTRGPCQIKP